MTEAAVLPGADHASERLLPPASLTVHARADLVPELARKEYRELREDVARRGLLVPLEVTPESVLLDGRARLRVARELGLERVPVRAVAVEDELEYIVRAALLRRQLTESQRAALAVELATYHEAKREGEERRLANLRRGRAPEVATLPPRGERTREFAARLAGVSPRTVQDAATVCEQDAELFQAVKAGKLPAHRAAQKVRRARRDASLPPPPPLPAGPYDLIYADPPWRSHSPGSDWAPERHYPTMTVAEIAALPVPAAEDALLFLWAVNALLPEALEVMRAWGFTYKTNLAWVKESIGLGFWTRNRHELLLFGIRGKVAVPDEPDRPDSVIAAARGRHSEKPEVVYERIERMAPDASKLELFARATRPGWVAWGNEVPA